MSCYRHLPGLSDWARWSHNFSPRPIRMQVWRIPIPLSVGSELRKTPNRWKSDEKWWKTMKMCKNWCEDSKMMMEREYGKCVENIFEAVIQMIHHPCAFWRNKNSPFWSRHVTTWNQKSNFFQMTRCLQNSPNDEPDLPKRCHRSLGQDLPSILKVVFYFQTHP